MKSTPRSSPVPSLSALSMWTVGLCALLFLSAPMSLAEQVAAPLIEPIPTAQQMIDGISPQPPGSGNPPVTLTITTATEGATIYYLIRDNNTISVFPTHLPPYDPANKPVIAQAGTRWVGAMAVKAGMEDSDVVWQEYKIHAPVIELVGYLSFSPVGIDTTSEKQISIYNRGDMDLTITSIAIESDDPGAWSHNFSGPLVLLPSRVTYLKVTFAPTEVKEYSAVFAVESDAAGGSNIRSASGTGFDPTKVAAVAINSSMSEPYFSPVEIWMQSNTALASIYYTLDGSDPTESSTLYDHGNKPALIALGEVVVKAKGFKDGLTSSEITSRTFEVVELELTANHDFFFDPVQIGPSGWKDLPLVLTNVGSRSIDISNIEIDDENFSVNWTGPVTIPVAGVQEYIVRFKPLTRFDLFANMTITTNANGGDLNRYLNGHGLASEYGVDPATKNVAGAGESYTVWVSIEGSWTASEILDWVSIVATPGLGMVVVTVDPNPTEEIRTGNVGIGGKTHSIVQAVVTDPLIGGTLVEGYEGWFWSEWFGFYSTSGAPWLFHAQHGFIFRYQESSNESMFIYDDAMVAWWWTNEQFYPFLHVWDPPVDIYGTDIEDAWLYYFEGSKTPREFGVIGGTEFLFFNP